MINKRLTHQYLKDKMICIFLTHGYDKKIKKCDLTKFQPNNKDKL